MKLSLEIFQAISTETICKPVSNEIVFCVAESHRRTLTIMYGANFAFEYPLTSWTVLVFMLHL